MTVVDRADRAQIEALAEIVSDRRAAMLTGAGVSTDSGIPDYRSPGAPPRSPMRIDEFMRDEAYRRRFWAGARIGAERMSGIEPNAGHWAIARLEQIGRLTGVITQNVDGLHGRAGTRELAELHGNGGVIRCVTEGHRFSRTEVLSWFDVANPGFAERHAGAEIAPDGDAAVTETAGVRVPMCPVCGGVLRPDVVYFGEHAPRQVFEHAASILAAADALVVAGSSLAVNTGIRLVHRAERRGLPIVVINRGPTAVDHRPSLRLRIDGGTSETLTALARMLDA